MKPLGLEVRVAFALRVRALMQEHGYWKDGHPDVARFAQEHHFHRNNVYRWINGQMPGLDVVRLARAFGIEPVQLLPPEVGQPERPFVGRPSKLLLVLALGAACLGLPSPVSAGQLPDSGHYVKYGRRRAWALA